VLAHGCDTFGGPLLSTPFLCVDRSELQLGIRSKLVGDHPRGSLPVKAITRCRFRVPGEFLMRSHNACLLLARVKCEASRGQVIEVAAPSGADIADHAAKVLADRLQGGGRNGT
jgi:hypothetical protein